MQNKINHFTNINALASCHATVRTATLNNPPALTKTGVSSRRTDKIVLFERNFLIIS